MLFYISFYIKCENKDGTGRNQISAIIQINRRLTDTINDDKIRRKDAHSSPDNEIIRQVTLQKVSIYAASESSDVSDLRHLRQTMQKVAQSKINRIIEYITATG